MQESCVSACLYPAAQKQNSTALLPFAELECSGHAAQTCASVLALAVPYVSSAHSVHGAAPASGLKLPYGHGAHSPPSSPVFPGSHVQFTAAVLPAGELERAGHGVHVLLAAAPSAPEKVLGAHARHVAGAEAPTVVE